MFWLIKKIIGLAVLAVIAFFVLNYQVGGRPIKDHLLNFYHSPFAQEALRQGKDSASGYLNDFLNKPAPSKSSVKEPEIAPPMEKIDERDRHELEGVLKKK